jgi:hypothetical protein
MNIDHRDVLTDDTQKDQLYRRKKEQADDNRRGSHREAIPEQELINQVKQADQEAYHPRNKTHDHSKAQRYFGVAGDS